MARQQRDDIQGIRALAVAVVIAGHAGVPFLPGGFVGVDVFFVVSGYLIAGLLFREVLTAGGITLSTFWARRARRILPVATLVTVVTVSASLIWMSVLDARQTIDDALWATAFTANWHFAAIGTDYFAHSQPPSPMQHYWSLAVEEQFYLVWPLMLAVLLLAVRLTRRLRGRAATSAAQRLPRRAVITMLVIITVASLAWSVYATVSSPVPAYFSTFTRAWELGVGALLALVPPSLVRSLSRRRREVTAAAGLAIVLASCVVVTGETPYPGIAATLPVGGAALLVLAGIGARPTVVGRMLSLAPFRTIGDWSYSLYLWHWPALVVPAIALERPLTPYERLLAVLAAVVASAFTYTYVETPFRAGRPAARLPRQRALLLYPATAAVVVIACTSGWSWTSYVGGEHGDNPAIAVTRTELTDSGDDETEALVRASVTAARDHEAVPSNLTPNLLDVRSSIADVGSCDYTQDVRSLCERGDIHGARTLVVIGDSHARAWIPAFNRIAEEGGWRAYYLVKPQCTAAHVEIASMGSDEPFTDCTDFQTWVIAQVRALHPDLVVVASSPPVNGVFVDGKRTNTVAGITPALRSGYDNLFTDLEQSADRVALIRDVPKSPDDPATCLGTGSPTLGDCMFQPVERSTVLGDVGVASAQAEGVQVVDPTPWLCWQGECPVVIGGTLSYRDTDHITTEYAANLWGELGRALQMLPTGTTGSSGSSGSTGSNGTGSATGSSTASTSAG